MDFDNSKPIYLQIAEVFYENILEKKWKEEERIPSVREIAMLVEVNPNTAIRAFNHLQDLGVIYNKRGIGYFVNPEAQTAILDSKRREFFDNVLPEFLRSAELLGISTHEIKSHLDNVKNGS